MLLRHRYSAGRSAEDYYREALRQWRDQPLLRNMRLACLALLTSTCMIEFLWVQETTGWLLGAAAALGATGYVVLNDWAPEHIENWHTGAESERRTEKTLRVLQPEGWHAVHDLPTPFGNIDHVVVGPGGVFLLNTKQLGGSAAVDGDVVRVTRRTNKRGGYTNSDMAGSTRGAAYDLHRELRQTLGRAPWVQGVVVFWNTFDEGPTESNRVVYLHGSDLAAWLRDQPARLRPEAVAAIGATLRARTAPSSQSVERDKVLAT